MVKFSQKFENYLKDFTGGTLELHLRNLKICCRKLGLSLALSLSGSACTFEEVAEIPEMCSENCEKAILHRDLSKNF